MERSISLDIGVRRKPVYLDATREEIGFIDDVLIDPAFGVLALVSHGNRWGTWAFPYMHTRILDDSVIVAAHRRQSPGDFLRTGRSYQDMLGKCVVTADGLALGTIRDVELVDFKTGGISYWVAASGVQGLWSFAFVIHAPTEVVRDSGEGVVVKTRRPVKAEQEGSNEQEMANRHASIAQRASG
jgi:uncharacterized protein YrrD